MTAPACGSCGSPVNDATICQGCTRDLAMLLLTAASIAPDLDDAVAKLLKRGTGGPRSETEAPLPFDLAASDAYYALRGAVAGFVLIANAVRPQDGFPDGGDLAAMGRWCAGRLGILRQAADVPSIIPSLRERLHRALAVIDRKPERSPAGTCDQCGAQLLAELDTDTAVCACGNVVTGLLGARYERALKADQLGTPAELSAFLARIGIRIPRGTITSWASRGRLGARGKSGMYALSDVLALHAQSQARVRG